jgi:hypothetical protein
MHDGSNYESISLLPLVSDGVVGDPENSERVRFSGSSHGFPMFCSGASSFEASSWFSWQIIGSDRLAVVSWHEGGYNASIGTCCCSVS